MQFFRKEHCRCVIAAERKLAASIFHTYVFKTAHDSKCTFGCEATGSKWGPKFIVSLNCLLRIAWIVRENNGRFSVDKLFPTLLIAVRVRYKGFMNSSTNFYEVGKIRNLTFSECTSSCSWPPAVFRRSVVLVGCQSVKSAYYYCKLNNIGGCNTSWLGMTKFRHCQSLRGDSENIATLKMSNVP